MNNKCPFNKMRECDHKCALRVNVTASSDNGYTTGKACAFAVMASNVDYSSAAVFVSDTTFTGNLKPGQAGDAINKVMRDMEEENEHQHEITVEEIRTPDSRDLFIGFRAKCERCGEEVLGNFINNALKSLKEKPCK